MNTILVWFGEVGGWFFYFINICVDQVTTKVY